VCPAARVVGLQRLIDAVANGQLTVLIDRVFPLAEAAQAHRYILERKAFGARAPSTVKLSSSCLRTD
jgi:NADPH2:quinone reductase